jgi:hypothetical protein
MHTTQHEELNPSATDLLVFVDDTGHETFAGDQGYYGLGGCATLGGVYAHIKAQWTEIRNVINGDPNAPLHASMMVRSQENFCVLSRFFLDRSFFRIAVTTTRQVGLPPNMHPCAAVSGQLHEEIAIVAGFTHCENVWLIFESSQRADPVIRNCFAQLTPLSLPRPLRVIKCLMPKSSSEPGLEIADFIMGLP